MLTVKTVGIFLFPERKNPYFSAYHWAGVMPMMCAWNALLEIIPRRMRQQVDESGRYTLEELRLRQGAPPELVLGKRSIWMDMVCNKEDIGFCIRAASRYSPWAAGSIQRGFLTAPGGHRLGLCGLALYRDGQMTGMREITSVCIRIARDFPGIAASASKLPGSLLILGPPGWGKTTLLRDLIRQLENTEKIGVVDERGELFPEGIPRGNRVDILSGCSKQDGIPMLLRTMGPTCIAVDEITTAEDTGALLQAANCGVRLLATAHGSSVSDLQLRKTYRPLLENAVFASVLVLKKDKSFTTERMTEWVTSGSVQY